MRFPWSRGSSAQSTVHLWLLMAWAVFWCLILWWLTPLRGRALFNCGFLLLQPILLFLPTILLPFLFRPTACSFLNDSVWPLGFLLHHLRAPVSHLFLLGHPWPIYFPLASLALFLTLHSYGLFTNSFGLPLPNYFIPHPWGSWTCHQPLTFFACITLGLLWPILTFLHHILPMGLPFLSLQPPLGPFASSRPICLFYGPAIHYSYHFGLMVFSIHLLTLSAHVVGLLLSIGLPKMIIDSRKS